MGRLTYSWADEPDLKQLSQLHSLLRSDPVRAVPELEALVDRGSVMSMLYLGDANALGKGLPINLLKAEEWYRRAAEIGSIHGVYQLGRLLRKTKRYSEAIEAFEVCATKGFTPAIYQLGRMYYYGIGVVKDRNASRNFLERASALGHVFAKRVLAGLLLSGRFGALQMVRGGWLLAVAIKDLVVITTVDPDSDKLC